MDAGEPVVKSDQQRVLPARIEEVNELAELFKAKEEEQMRVPMAPEVPKARRPEYSSRASALGRARFDECQSQDGAPDKPLQRDQAKGMAEVLREERDQAAG